MKKHGRNFSKYFFSEGAWIPFYKSPAFTTSTLEEKKFTIKSVIPILQRCKFAYKTLKPFKFKNKVLGSSRIAPEHRTSSESAGVGEEAHRPKEQLAQATRRDPQLVEETTEEDLLLGIDAE